MLLTQTQKLILVVTGFILYCFLDYAFADRLYSISDDLALWLQKQDSLFFNTLRNFIDIISMMSDRDFTNNLLIALWVLFGNKVQVLKMTTMYCISMYLNDIIKLILLQPRPFYSNDEFEITNCFTGYGGPSGHTARAVVFYTLLFKTMIFQKYHVPSDQYLLNNDQNLPEQELYRKLYPNAIMTYKHYMYILVVFLLMNGFSRIYLGIHYFTQVMLGWLVGWFVLYLYENHGIEDKLHHAFESSIDKLLSKKDITKVTVQFGSVTGFCAILAILLYYIDKENQDLQNRKEEWVKFIGRQITCEPTLKYFEGKDLVSTAIAQLPFYLFLSCLLGRGQYKPHLYGDVPFWRTMIRLIILIGLLHTANIYSTQTKKFITEPILRYFFIGQVYQIMISFLLIVVTPYIYRILRMDCNGDLYRKVSEVEQADIEL